MSPQLLRTRDQTVEPVSLVRTQLRDAADQDNILQVLNLQLTSTDQTLRIGQDLVNALQPHIDRVVDDTL